MTLIFSVWKHILKETSNSFSRFYQLLCKASCKANFAAPAEPRLSPHWQPAQTSHLPGALILPDIPPTAFWSRSAASIPCSSPQTPHGKHLELVEGWNQQGICGLVALSRPSLVKKGIMQIHGMSSSLYTSADSTFLGKAELVELKVALTFFMLMCYFDNYRCQRQKITYMPAPVFFLNIKNWVLEHL